MVLLFPTRFAFGRVEVKVALQSHSCETPTLLRDPRRERRQSSGVLIRRKDPHCQASDRCLVPAEQDRLAPIASLGMPSYLSCLATRITPGPSGCFRGGHLDKASSKHSLSTTRTIRQ